MTYAFLMSSVQMTRAVINGETSLGGSESSLVGLARALVARGHQVSIFTTRLGESDPPEDLVGYVDPSGVTWQRWEDFHQMNRFVEWDVVCSQRQMVPFAGRINARYRMLWTQDLLVPGDMVTQAMGIAWNVDRIAYVSEYHRAQWEQLAPDLKSLGWVTRNGYDATIVPDSTTRHSRIIHVSRPERGLGPLLEMWPALRERVPDAELRICRYSSMYDTGPGSWSDECARWDRRVAEVNEKHGGITWLGELNKPDLYRELSEATVMWYPGIDTFAETGCIAAIESQACGTPVVASYRGVCPDVVTFGTCVKGETASEEYQRQSVDAVVSYLRAPAFGYTHGQHEARAAMAPYAYAEIAEQWDETVTAAFDARYATHAAGVLRRLLYEDDHVAARMVAESIGDADALALCDRVIAGEDHTAEQYGDAAIADPMREVSSPRFQRVVPMFEGCTRVLDAACGNGSFALALALTDPDVQVWGLDYSQANIDRARKAADDTGLSDRVHFECCPVYDYATHGLHEDYAAWAAESGHPFDGLFVGEFVEHVQNTVALVDGLEEVLTMGATVVYTCPHGACVELLPPRMPHRRGHVHRFAYDDIHAVWGRKANLSADFLDAGDTMRGAPLGNWLIRYETNGEPAGARPLSHRIVTTRPLRRLSAGIIAKNASADIRRCLDSLYGMADEIIVGIDPATSDETQALVEQYGRTVRAVPITSVSEQQDGFAGARNEVMAQCLGEWFLWIDADEVLVHPGRLRRYIDGSDVFRGFVVKQTHLYLDGAPTHDIPVRVFRRGDNIRFYGCVHEQPQQDDCNGQIRPTLEVNDTIIAHFGYLEEGQREYKRVTRNVPLLHKDQARFPDRELGKVLVIREAVITADHDRIRAQKLTERASAGYEHAIALYLRYFDTPEHHLDRLARPWYEAALQHLGRGWEMEIALAGEAGGMGPKHAKPERVWVRDADEYQRLLDFKVKAHADQMRPPVFITNPDDLLVKEPAHELVTG